jgi:ABC-2 type transport system permease protein
MNKTLIILRNEIATTFSRPSFLFVTFGLPVLVFIIFWAISLLETIPVEKGPTTHEAAKVKKTGANEGYVDKSGLITIKPDGAIPLKAFAGEKQARLALDAGDIAGYYIIPKDYKLTKTLVYVTTRIHPGNRGNYLPQLEWLLTLNLLNGDYQALRTLTSPVKIDVSIPAAGRDRPGESHIPYYIPLGITMLLSFSIFMSASLLFNSMTIERKNKVLEILLVSIKPTQLLGGKIIGLGIVSLLQLMIWTITGYGLLRLMGNMLSETGPPAVPAAVLSWGILFYVLGYLLYSILAAGVGVLAPGLQDTSQVSFLIIFPLVVPFFVLEVLSFSPQGVLFKVLSLFPLTSPVAMITRMAASAGRVPWWQLLCAAGLILLTSLLLIRFFSKRLKPHNMLDIS